MRRAALHLLLCLLLALVPAADARNVATLDAGAAEGAGTNTLDGDLIAFFSQAPADQAPAPGGFRLEAERLRVETDREDRSSVAGLSPLPSSPVTSSVAYGAARTEGAGAGQDTYFFVAALPEGAPPTVHVEAQRLRLEAADGAPAEAQRFVNSDRPPVSVGTLGGHRAALDGGARVAVEGDFLLVLWDWDLRVETGRGTTEHPSGREELRDVGGVATEVRLRQAYVFATGARLEFEVERGGDLGLLLDARDWQAAGEVRFERPDGRLRVEDGSVQVQAPELVLKGEFGIAVGRASGGTLPLVVRGGGDATAHLAGDVYLLAQPDGWLGRLAASLAAAAVLALGALAARRHLAARRLRGLEAAMDAGRYDEVLRVGPRLLDGRDGGTVALALGTIHLRQERPQDALACLGRPRRWTPDLLGSRAFLSAVGHAALGQAERARQHLDASLRFDPTLEAEARRHPALRRLLPDLLDRDVV